MEPTSIDFMSDEDITRLLEANPQWFEIENMGELEVKGAPVRSSSKTVLGEFSPFDEIDEKSRAFIQSIAETEFVKLQHARELELQAQIDANLAYMMQEGILPLSEKEREQENTTALYANCLLFEKLRKEGKLNEKGELTGDI